jgi:hypothetical protein
MQLQGVIVSEKSKSPNAMIAAKHVAKTQYLAPVSCPHKAVSNGNCDACATIIATPFD